MPKLSEASIAIRVDRALSVLQRLSADPKLTQKEACKQVGIDVGTYRSWIGQANEAILAFQQTIGETERMELSQILIAREAITEMLIKDALARTTDPLSRLGIKQYLDKRADELGERHRGIDHQATRDLLSGPELAPGESRYASSGTTVEVKKDGEVQITVKPPPQVVEGSYVNDPPPIAQQQPSELGRIMGSTLPGGDIPQV